MKWTFCITLTILIVLRLALAVWADSLLNLKQRSCDLYVLANAEYVACRDFPATCSGELGAYARNGGATSKLAKMCEFRVLDMMSHCSVLNYTSAYIDVIHAEDAMQNWVGQTVGYVRNGQMPGSYAEAYFGLGVTTADITTPSTTTQAKEDMWAIADVAGPQEPIVATALSILADLKNRLAQSNVCD
jgi:hypothetical protein